jgi:hypothetical protein
MTGRVKINYIGDFAIQHALSGVGDQAIADRNSEQFGSTQRSVPLNSSFDFSRAVMWIIIPPMKIFFGHQKLSADSLSAASC